ncbi:efflux RND transporter periplasmic adaptor subunit [Wandonia haliotis]|uniref:Efflux RND transporter periplasmic adaptor subunit n=1 Tax=Wandonia haliotis TaxID=574963 RepID=A0ABN1MNU5_9FLAO
MKRKKIIHYIILSAIVLTGCGNEKTGLTPSHKEPFCLNAAMKKKSEFSEAQKEQVTEGLHLTGSVESNPDQVIHFVSLVGGIITNTSFSLGDEVKKGQVLAELRSPELSSLQAEQKNLEALIRVAQQKLEATQSMYSDGISSQKELLEAQSELDILKSEREKVKANLNLFSASPEKNVFQIKAPVSGIITAKSIASGTQISAESEPLFTISDLSEVWVMANVYATNVQNIETGIPVEIRTLSYPGEVFRGQVNAISQVYDNEARVLKARIILPNPELKLKPGMPVDIIAIRQLEKEAVSIPTQSIVFDDNKNYVVIYKSDCELEIREIDLLSKNNGTSFISEGVLEHEKVLSKNQLLLYEQLKNFMDR